MAISLKEIGEKILSCVRIVDRKSISDSQGQKQGIRFKTDDDCNILINTGYVLEPENYEEVTYALPLIGNETTYFISVQPYNSNPEAGDIPHWNSWVKNISTTGFTFGYAGDLINAGDYGYFLSISLTIYYIVRYNIYRLVLFLSHLDTKFGGERR